MSGLSDNDDESSLFLTSLSMQSEEEQQRKRLLLRAETWPFDLEAVSIRFVRVASPSELTA